MSSTEDDLDYLADRVRFFVDQEIPTATSWNVDPDILQQSLRRTGTGFTDVEARVTTVENTVDGIVLPDGTLKPIGEWVVDPGKPTYIDGSTFALVGDRTADFRPGARLRTTAASTQTIVTVNSVLYNGGTNQTVLGLTTPGLSPAVSRIETSIVKQSAPAARTVDILDLAVTTAKLADIAVTTAKIADQAVTAAKLALQAVGSAQLADAAVTDAKIGFKSIQGTTRIADNSIVGSSTLQDKSVTTAKLADGAVTNVKIAAGTITGDRLVPGTITSTQLAPGAVGAANIPDRSLPNTKLVAYSLRDTEIADGVIYGGVTRNHIVDKSIVASSKLQDRSIGYWDIALGHVRGSWNGVQNEIGQGTISGEADIQSKSIWGNNRIADASIPWNLLVNNASLYSVNATRAGGFHYTGNGQTADMIAFNFNVRGGSWVFAFFCCNGAMRAGQAQMNAVVYWMKDWQVGQGYNVAALDPGEAGNPTMMPCTVVGFDWWAPAAGTHTYGIRGVLNNGQGNNRFWDVYNCDLLVIAMA